MRWHEGTVRDLPLIPYLLLLRMTQLLPQEPEQADLCGVQSPAKPRPVPSGPSKEHPHGQDFSVEMGDTGRQGCIPASEADRPHCKGWKVCSTPYPLIQVSMGRGRSLTTVQSVKSCCSLQHCVKLRGKEGNWGAGWQVLASVCSLLPEETILPPSSGGPQALLLQGEYAVQDEGCNRDAQTEVCKRSSSWSPDEQVQSVALHWSCQALSHQPLCSVAAFL